jgi:hypothetical protein
MPWCDIQKNVVELIDTIARETGEASIADEVAACLEVNAAVVMAAEWVAAHRCLFVCVDVWDTDANEARLLSYLHGLFYFL